MFTGVCPSAALITITEGDKLTRYNIVIPRQKELFIGLRIFKHMQENRRYCLQVSNTYALTRHKSKRQ